MTGTAFLQQQTACAKKNVNRPDLHAFLNNLPVAVYQRATDTGWTIEYGSAKLETLTGHPLDALLSGKISSADLIHPDDIDLVRSRVRQAIATRSPYTLEYRMRRGDKKEIWVSDEGMAVYAGSDEAVALEGCLTDITSRRMEQEAVRVEMACLRKQAALLDRATDAVIECSANGNVIYWNAGAEKFYGWKREEALGKLLHALLALNVADFNAARDVLLANGEWEGEVRGRCKDGREVLIASRETLMLDGEGRPATIFSIHTDMTARKSAEEKIRRLAFYDQLTQLPNRQLMLDRLKHAMAVGARSGRIGAVMFLDLDNFKSLNDTMGHDYGDLLLQHVSRRISGNVRECDLVSRQGGDEFVVLLENLSPDRAEAARQADVIAQKILSALSEPYMLSDYSHLGGSSIGVALFLGHEFAHEALLKRADYAMYQAKAAGRGTIRFFDPNMQAVVNDRVAMDKDLREGLKKQQFFVMYQPQVDIAGKVVGAEALLRWNHPKRGIVTPAEFISLAEESGLIVDLGRLALREAKHLLATWTSDRALSGITLSVNVSPRQLRDPALIEEARGLIADSALRKGQLKLEVTDTLFAKDRDGAAAIMMELTALGAGFAIASFGTGYSSLSYVQQLPLDQIKIDRSFIRNAPNDRESAAIVATIISLGRIMDLDVVAEGVETEAERQFLVDHGCQIFQGYFFSGPLSAQAFETFARRSVPHIPAAAVKSRTAPG